MQVLLVLACLRKGERFAELAAGFGINTASASRYLTGTVALSTPRDPKLRQASAAARGAGHAYLVIDSTLIPSTGWPRTGRPIPASTGGMG